MPGFEPLIGTWWVSTMPDRAVTGFLQQVSGVPEPWQLTVGGMLADLEQGDQASSADHTLHGSTPDGDMTLLNASQPRRGGHPQAQVWGGRRLLAGGHITPGERFRSAGLQLPYLFDWIGPTRDNEHSSEHFAVDLEGDPIGFDAVLHDDLRLSLNISLTESYADDARSFAAHSQYDFGGPNGVDLVDVDRIQHALGYLHSILMGEYLAPSELKLTTRHSALRNVTVLDGAPDSGLPGQFAGTAFLDTGEIEFNTFMNSWFRLYCVAPNAIRAAGFHDLNPRAESRIVDLCNGLEALAAHLWSAPPPDADDEEVVSLLAAGGVRSDLRRFVKLSLERRRWSLEDKLSRLARTMGADSASWLLGSSLTKWAHLVARLRNSIAHGKPLPNGLGDDPIFTTMVMKSAEAALRLALLSSAGYSNRLAPRPGELLRAEGDRVASHPRSRFYRRLIELADYSADWERWHHQLA